tara:strand:+ start:232 stop:426 length:195 start_codon:yes stop_codon:yes gene_type:complete
MTYDIITFIIFVCAVIATLDYITDTIEIMSGNSEAHKRLNETKPDMNYCFGVVFLWSLFYLFNQ